MQNYIISLIHMNIGVIQVQPNIPATLSFYIAWCTWVPDLHSLGSLLPSTRHRAWTFVFFNEPWLRHRYENGRLVSLHDQYPHISYLGKKHMHNCCIGSTRIVFTTLRTLNYFRDCCPWVLYCSEHWKRSPYLFDSRRMTSSYLSNQVYWIFDRLSV